MIIPSPALFYLLLGWAMIGLSASIFPSLHSVWVLSGLAIALAVLIDIFSLLGKNPVQCRRKVAGSLSVGVWTKVLLEFHNTKSSPVQIEAFDYCPLESDYNGLPLKTRIAKNGWVKHTYTFRPMLRGIFDFEKIQMRILGTLGLVKRNYYFEDIDTVHVYPNFANVIKYNLLAHEQRAGAMGIRKIRRRGEGLEFEQLREYRLGDTLRQIDWKATARIRKLISREYQDERDQRVVFLLDCGRRMNTLDGDLSHFDHTLNSILLLSYVAIRQGDSVGLMTFSGPERWMTPRKGANVVNTVLNTVFDLHPSLKESDYVECATRLIKLLTKRSLVVLVTNLRDEDTDELLPALHILKRRHLVLLANMRERVLDDTLKEPVEGFSRCLEQAALHYYMEHRHKQNDAIKNQGVLTLDVTPEHLAVNMVNKYLEIKSGGRL